MYVVVGAAPALVRRGATAGLLAAVGALTLLSCAASGRAVKDPDAEATCQAAEAEDVLLVKCGRFGLALVPVEDDLDDEPALRTYRELLTEQVGAALLVVEEPFSMGGQAWPGFRWETPDHVAPRSGRVTLLRVDDVLTSAASGPGPARRLLTCEVRDAGLTAQRLCLERMDEVLKARAELPRVPVEELRGAPPATAGR